MKKIIALIAVIVVFSVGAIVISPVIIQKIHSKTSSDALTLLKEGNAHFVEAKLKHPTRGARRRLETAKFGQNPYAVILACSDSRVPVEIIFNAGVGDIFVVSNAGNIGQDDIVAGSIEYAVKYLKVPLLVILGHTKCGAVQAALSDAPAAGNIRTIQKIIEPAATEAKNSDHSLRGAELLNAAVKDNVHKSKTDLLARSEIIKKMSDKGTLKIVTAVYDIETGSIEWEE